MNIGLLLGFAATRQVRQRPRTRRTAMALTLEEANRIIEGAVAKARELNIRISVAVCDAGGRPLAFQRMDNAIWASAYGSQGKAVASAAFGRIRPAERRTGRAGKSTHSRRHCHRRGRPHDHGPGRGTYCPQWCRRGRLRSWWRHRSAGRGLRPGWGRKVVAAHWISRRCAIHLCSFEQA
jgi:uncharacterized protein GlcG (DUF336 family)